MLQLYLFGGGKAKVRLYRQHRGTLYHGLLDKPVEELDSSHYTVWRHTLRIWKDYWWIVLGFLGASVALMGLIVTGFVQNMRRV